MISREEVKASANLLRDVLSAKGCQLKHSESLEIISRIDGYRDWNTYSADIAKMHLSRDMNISHEGDSSEGNPLKTESQEDKKEEKLLYCNFCGRSQHDVLKLIAGPEVCICDECADRCVGIIDADETLKLDELEMPNLQSAIRGS